ncbi:metal-sensitive transcriptional regulator [Paenibacillus antarcticus]|uniref:Cytoplasmic protein n=1 Tax=Paenibacillus antarcticus TaxID=253703 RepID=A0A168JT27_9BACL|nr:metal-sensitive transcriptional regulator [Paenibacillus antarcticus]OAB41061.1 cytoplasmic protein [Paenibacillus antarcticus]
MNYDENITRRLKRLEGQIRGVLKMMDEGKDCKEVVSQLSAVRNASDTAIAYIVATNLEHCILEDMDKGTDSRERIQSAVQLLIKSR